MTPLKTFAATDSTCQALIIRVIPQHLPVPGQPVPCDLFDQHGRILNWIRRGEYQVYPRAGEPVVMVTSEDEDAV